MAKDEALSPKVEIAADQNLVGFIKAGYPLLYMLTAEENRAELEIHRVAEECGRELILWSATEGLTDINSKSTDKILDPIQALAKIRTMGSKRIFILRDLHAFFKNPVVVRHLRDMARDFKQNMKHIILLSPVNCLPPELERDAVIIDFDLPTKDQLAEVWDNLYSASKELFESRKVQITEDERDRIIQAALGLTGMEAENAYSKAIVMSLRAAEDVRPAISLLVMKEKANAVKKSGILEYFEAPETKDDIGGLEVLKKWIDIRSKAFSKAARDFGLPMPKGILLVGTPGTGKSLTARAASNILGIPLIRFDISRVYGGIVGQSELAMRSALQTIERVGNCVVFIDEADKAFAGVGGSGNNDSGVTKRVFGCFLTWLQEKKSPSFVIMCVNNIDAIRNSAPEMLRKGRFDEIFFVGLPSEKERAEIFGIHIRRHGRKPENYNLKELAEKSTGFSGAEIEQGIIDAMFTAFYEDTEINQKHIIKSIKATKPLSITAGDTLENMKSWAMNNATNASADIEETKSGRHIDN